MKRLSDLILEATKSSSKSKEELRKLGAIRIKKNINILFKTIKNDDDFSVELKDLDSFLIIQGTYRGLDITISMSFGRKYFSFGKDDDIDYTDFDTEYKISGVDKRGMPNNIISSLNNDVKLNNLKMIKDDIDFKLEKSNIIIEK